jgi:hypothetical protein
MLQDLIETHCRHPRGGKLPIAVAVTPEFKEFLDRRCIQIGCPDGAKGIFKGLDVYVWRDLPVHCKLYYRQDLVDFEYLIYGINECNECDYN